MFLFFLLFHCHILRTAVQLSNKQILQPDLPTHKLFFHQNNIWPSKMFHWVVIFTLCSIITRSKLEGDLFFWVNIPHFSRPLVTCFSFSFDTPRKDILIQNVWLREVIISPRGAHRDFGSRNDTVQCVAIVLLVMISSNSWYSLSGLAITT